jgi:hypothetical protein
VAVERGWLSRAEAAARTLVTLRFLFNSPHGDGLDVTGYKGFYYHFLDRQTGRRVWQPELSPIDTTFLLAGMLTASVYFRANAYDEIEIRELVDSIYRRIDWQWAQNEEPSVWQGWKPEAGFLHYGGEGYSEAILLCVLGMASPTHPLSATSYEKWTSTYQWENLYGFDCRYAGPLFIHQFSHAWLDLKEFARPLHEREAMRLFREQPPAGTYIQRLCCPQSARIRRLW